MPRGSVGMARDKSHTLPAMATRTARFGHSRENPWRYLKEEETKLYLRKDKKEEGIIIEAQDYNWQEYVYSVQRDEFLLQCSGEIRCLGMKISITLSSRWRTASKFYEPLPIGDYNLLAPDYPHTGLYSRFYRPDPNHGMFDLVWFPIEYDNNSRYLHMGHLSEGCVTVTNIKE